ncbi:metalloregulator ArsR/SmtB family transcription factor [Yinghuangia sp. ASG 101]|nr:metalloregulator ArsR/SmtB family transcription factor [Yinghuangia sp. ASG 101]UGQ11583.1 metalloregulator ArsR/SmtB family transcription factor [Yinghuangia sp. ASG 101]
MASGPDGVDDPSEELFADAGASLGLLASSARLHIMWVLIQGESDVTGLAERVGGTLPAVSQHLTKLKLGGLVRARRQGRRVVYLVDDHDVAAMVHWFMSRRAGRETATTPAEHPRRLGA